MSIGFQDFNIYELYEVISMYAMGFTEAFMELFNMNAAIIIFFCCGYILFKTCKLDLVALKARVFLNKSILHQTWIYMAVAGITIALNTIIKFLLMVTILNSIFNIYYIIELIQIIFLIAFTLLFYSWSLFVKDYTHGFHYGANETVPKTSNPR
jgi:hypothetical protein